jgi:hypothetical protein
LRGVGVNSTGEFPNPLLFSGTDRLEAEKRKNLKLEGFSLPFFD